MLLSLMKHSSLYDPRTEKKGSWLSLLVTRFITLSGGDFMRIITHATVLGEVPNGVSLRPGQGRDFLAFGPAEVGLPHGLHPGLEPA